MPPPIAANPATSAAGSTSVSATASASAASAAYSSAQTVNLIGTTGRSPLHPHRAIATPRTATTMALSNPVVVTTSPNVVAVPAVLMPTTSAAANAAAAAAAYPFQVNQILGVNALSGGLHSGAFHIDPRIYAVTGAE
ncbi:MAG: hypothetical protein M1840_000148 [Geoglossum simile]|nr:MAG: hypothetical protein M1840_000148 [Geoglossum simile]